MPNVPSLFSRSFPHSRHRSSTLSRYCLVTHTYLHIVFCLYCNNTTAFTSLHFTLCLYCNNTPVSTSLHFAFCLYCNNTTVSISSRCHSWVPFPSLTHTLFPLPNPPGPVLLLLPIILRLPPSMRSQQDSPLPVLVSRSESERLAPPPAATIAAPVWIVAALALIVAYLG